MMELLVSVLLGSDVANKCVGAATSSSDQFSRKPTLSREIKFQASLSLSSVSYESKSEWAKGSEIFDKR